MKAFFLGVSIAASMAAVSTGIQAQDISQDQVPSVIRNNFETAFPKAKGTEWEMEGNLYNVEFETGLNTDHEAWYNRSGKLIKHKEEISRKALPVEVKRLIERDFKGYRTSDAEKITTDTSTVYRLELNSRSQEWQIAVDPDGKLIHKVAD